MAKIPYLIRRKNVFYFRLGVPAELRGIIQSREIIQSLRTQNSKEAQRKALKLAAHFKTLLHDLKAGKRKTINKSELFNISNHSPDVEESAPLHPARLSKLLSLEPFQNQTRRYFR